jgi:uncharacterized damage-inducible protein DinB
MTLHQTSDELLTQLQDIIDQLEDGHFSAPVAILNSATLGQHMRHTIEFFLCLMDGKTNGSINYDERKHDVFIEQNPQLAIRVIESIQEFLKKEPQDFDMLLMANYSIVDDVDQVIPSSFYRELAYNIEHTIHHMAFLKIAIRNDFDYVTLPKHFGVASSTVRHQLHQR